MSLVRPRDGGYVAIPSVGAAATTESRARRRRRALAVRGLALASLATSAVVVSRWWWWRRGGYPKSNERHAQKLNRPRDDDDDALCRARAGRRFRVVRTSFGAAGAPWSEVPCAEVAAVVSSSSAAARVVVDHSSVPATFGPILGFGGAFTDAAALNWLSLDEAGRAAVLDALYGPDGLGHTLARVPVHSCDFSVDSYTFDDVEDDLDLRHFDVDVERDRALKLRLILAAKDAADGALRVVASPWSPPAWMKRPAPGVDSPNATRASTMNGSASPTCLRDGVGPTSRYARAWANYLSKFATAYKDAGAELWAMTVQNEPLFAAPWEACVYDVAHEKDFVRHHLGPVLREDHPDLKLLVYDHNKDQAPEWADALLDDGHVDGLATHWYFNGDLRNLDGAIGAPNAHDLPRLRTDGSPATLLSTEACHCPSTGYALGDPGTSWERAERYAHAMLADLAAGSAGWIEWNYILDARGGPNHLDNMCDAPLLAVPYRAVGASPDAPRRADWEAHDDGVVAGDLRTREELVAAGAPAHLLDVGVLAQPMYFYAGHVSRFVRPGALAASALVDGSASPTDRVLRRATDAAAGGGRNKLAVPGAEATLWPCEGSTRQDWEIASIDDGAASIRPRGADVCLTDRVDPRYGTLVLADCDGDDAGRFVLENREDTTIVVRTASSNACLALAPLGNGGGANGVRGGARVVATTDCDSPRAAWTIDSGEMIVRGEDGGEACLTTGWPFLQTGAFRNKDGGKVVIVLNEAAEAVDYVLTDAGTKEGDEPIATVSVPARSIDTITFE